MNAYYFVSFYITFYDYHMHVEGLLHANLCLVTVLSSEQCLQFERFRLRHVQIVNKASSFKTKFIGNSAEVNRVNYNTL